MKLSFLVGQNQIVIKEPSKAKLNIFREQMLDLLIETNETFIVKRFDRCPPKAQILVRFLILDRAKRTKQHFVTDASIIKETLDDVLKHNQFIFRDAIIRLNQVRKI